MTRTTSGSAVASAMVVARRPASAGVVCIFQLPAMITGRIRPIMAARPVTRRPPPRRGPRGAPAPAARPAERGPSRPPVRPATPPVSDRRAWATARTGAAWAASRPSPSTCSMARTWRVAAAATRPRFAVSALRTRLSWPRRDRTTSRLSSSSTAADAPADRRNRTMVSVRFQVTTPARRRTRQAAGISTAARRAARPSASSAATTNSRCVRPAARLSEPRARKRPRR